MAPANKQSQNAPASVAVIRVGPAGWSYPDWAGYVYPSRRRKGFHEATYLAEFFDTIEINTSFYHPIRPDHAAQWIDRVAANPRFVFTAKLWVVVIQPRCRVQPEVWPVITGVTMGRAGSRPDLLRAPRCCRWQTERSAPAFPSPVSSHARNRGASYRALEALRGLSAGRRSAARVVAYARDVCDARGMQRGILQHRPTRYRPISGALGGK